MKRFTKYFAAAVLFSLLSSTAVWAQATAQISGTVKDQSGAVLPGVEIVATQTETGISRNTISNETGSYVLPNLPVGPYRLEVSLPGFRTFVQTGIVLEVNSNPVINPILGVGQRSEQIQVEANAGLVETRNVGVGQTMEFRRILELPLNGRMVTELITLGGGAVDIPLYASSPRSMQGQAAISVAGGLPSGVAYSLDGAMHNNPYDNLSLPLPFPDALQEFKVETGALSASQGQHSGAQVSSVTKSGTNEFHGDLFEFVRNDLLNATEYFARVDSRTGNKVHSTLKRNQFGGTLGGPIVRSKLFFFGGYQGTTERSDPSNVQRWVPTPAMLQGDFTTVTSPACGRSLTLPTPFVNNRIDPSSFNPIALNLVKKLPQTTDPCGLTVIGVPAKTNTSQYVGKTDYQLNAAHSIMGRVLFTKESQPVPYELAPDNLLTTFDRGRSNLAQSYAIGDTWLVSPQTVVSSRLVANYTDIRRLGAAFFNFSDIGVKNFYSGYQPKYLQLTVNEPGFTLGGGTANDSTYRTFSSGLNMDASLSRGAHQWAIGGALEWIDSNSNANVTSSGSFTFGNQFTGFPLADFLLGRPSSFTQSTPNTDYMRKWYMALYLADTWKVNQRWTLNYGLRWEPDLAETLTLGRVTTYSEQRRAAATRSTVFTKAPLGFYFPGDPGFPGKTGRERNWLEFAPRFGFAWDVKGDGRTSLRASAGIGYDYPNAQYHLWTGIVPPFGSSTTLFNPSFEDPWGTVPGGNPFPVRLGPDASFVPFGGFTTMSNIHPAQVQNWNLSIQRQLANDWLVSANYLGSHTIHMLGSEQLNPASYFPGNSDANANCFAQGYTVRTLTPAGAPAPGTVCSPTANTNPRRRLSLIDSQQTGQYVGNLVEIQSGGNASYNGLLLEARKRAARGVTVTGNYTWSHCIGPFQGNEGGDTGANPALPNPFPGNRDRGRGNCLGDRRHLVNLTSVLEMPRFQNNTLRYVASGWQLSTIYRYSTGAYFNIVAGNNNDFARNGTNINNQPAVYLGGDSIGDHSGGPNTFWFGKSCVPPAPITPDCVFTTPALGTFGNVGTRSVVGPGHWDLNMGLSRSFRFKEGQRVDFRWEVFNVPNSFRPLPSSINNPLVIDVTNRLFGQLRASDSPRIMQFALRYVF